MNMLAVTTKQEKKNVKRVEFELEDEPACFTIIAMRAIGII